KATDLCQESRLLDLAVLYKKTRVADFFLKDLKMKCSRTLLLRYVRSDHRWCTVSFADLMGVLDGLNYPINQSVLLYACRAGLEEAVRYLVDKRSMVLKSQHLEFLLLRGRYG